jgi:ankyrin repeat protein
MGRSIGLELWR